jgi:hypothetical protein
MIKLKITSMVTKVLYIHSNFKPSDVFLHYILYFCIYFMEHKRKNTRIVN